MHLNPQHPNILSDMRAAAQGRDLRNQRYGITTAKRHLIPRKSYPYASERQSNHQIRQLYRALSAHYKAET